MRWLVPPNLIELTSKTGLPLWPSGKEYTCNARDVGGTGSVPGSGPSPGGGNSNGKNPMNGEACRAAAMGSQRRRTRPSDEHMQTRMEQFKPVPISFSRRFTCCFNSLGVSFVRFLFFPFFSVFKASVRF